MMDTDLKGWLPRLVVDRAIPGAMEEFMTFLRRHVYQLNSKNDSR
jgi:hypothetical protein